MRNVRVQGSVVACAVGVFWSAASVASALELSVASYEVLVPRTSTDVTTISFDYSSGPAGFIANRRCIRVYGYYNNDDPESPEPQWMMPCRFITSHPDTGQTGDWFRVDTDYGPYCARLGDPGTMKTVHHFEVALNRHNGLFEWRFDGVKLSFLNNVFSTNDPQPNGDSYLDPLGVPTTMNNTFFADEAIDPATNEFYGVANAADMGWWWDDPSACPCWEYGVGGLGEYYLIFEMDTPATVNNIRPGMMGDANLDGTVDGEDAAILQANWMATGKTFTDGDFNLDTIVNDDDAAILEANWGKTASLEPYGVPEPSTWCLLAGALAMLAVGRRKSR